MHYAYTDRSMPGSPNSRSTMWLAGYLWIEIGAQIKSFSANADLVFDARVTHGSMKSPLRRQARHMQPRM